MVCRETVEHVESLGKISINRFGSSKREELVCRETDLACIATWVSGASVDGPSSIDAMWWIKSLVGSSAIGCWPGHGKGQRPADWVWSDREMALRVRKQLPEEWLFGWQWDAKTLGRLILNWMAAGWSHRRMRSKDSRDSDWQCGQMASAQCFPPCFCSLSGVGSWL